MHQSPLIDDKLNNNIVKVAVEIKINRRVISTEEEYNVRNNLLVVCWQECWANQVILTSPFLHYPYRWETSKFGSVIYFFFLIYIDSKATTKVRLYQLVRLMVDELALRYKAKVSSWISRAKFLSNGHFSTFTFFQPFKVHTLLVKEFHDMMRAVVNNYCVTRRKAYVIILRSLLQNWLVKMQSMPGNITSLWLVAFVNSNEKK